MKAKNLLIIVMSMFFIGMSATAFAYTNITDQIVEDRSSVSEEVYSEYQNSGVLMGVFEGNISDSASDLDWLEGWLIDNQGYAADFELVQDFKFEFDDNNTDTSGTWSTPSSNPISMYLVKAGGGFAIYDENPASATGFWSTYDLWQHGLNNGASLEISHLSGYDPGAGDPVPEPSTVILLGCGLLGLVAYKRKRK